MSFRASLRGSSNLCRHISSHNVSHEDYLKLSTEIPSEFFRLAPFANTSQDPRGFPTGQSVRGFTEYVWSLETYATAHSHAHSFPHWPWLLLHHDVRWQRQAGQQTEKSTWPLAVEVCRARLEVVIKLDTQLWKISWERQEKLHFSAGPQVTAHSAFRKDVWRWGGLFRQSRSSPQPRSGLAKLCMDERDRRPSLHPFLLTQPTLSDWCTVRMVWPWGGWAASPGL